MKDETEKCSVLFNIVGMSADDKHFDQKLPYLAQPSWFKIFGVYYFGLNLREYKYYLVSLHYLRNFHFIQQFQELFLKSIR